MRIVFAGTPEFAALHLQALLSDGHHEIVAVYTQPDRPAGRGKKLTASPVKSLAQAHGLPVLQPSSLKDVAQQKILQDLGADIMVVVAYGLLLPKTILETPKLGCINVHGSLLPRWRGAAPIQRAIEAGDKETGVTIMQMNEGLDTGDMLLKAHCPITEQDTGGSLHDKLAMIGPPALLKTLLALEEGTAVAEKQDDEQSNYAPKISKDEALLDWNQSAQSLALKVRAFNPFPVTYTTVGKADKTQAERLRIWRAEPAGPGSKEASPGAILKADKQGICINTANGGLVITELQLPGKKRLPVAELLKSRSELFIPGTVLGQQLAGQRTKSQ